VEFGQNAADKWTKHAENIDEPKQWITAFVIKVTPDIG
jgi:hypothetical protein